MGVALVGHGLSWYPPWSLGDALLGVATRYAPRGTLKSSILSSLHLWSGSPKELPLSCELPLLSYKLSSLSLMHLPRIVLHEVLLLWGM